MSFFKKRLNEERVQDFFLRGYRTMFSSSEVAENKKRLHELREHLPLLKNVKESDFNIHLTAVNIAWLDIAWTKYYFPKGISIVEASAMVKKVQDEFADECKPFQHVKSWVDTYSQAFGSSNTDGNTVMAEAFVSNLLGNEFEEALSADPEGLRETIAAFSMLFVKTFDLYTSMIKSEKLLS